MEKIKSKTNSASSKTTKAIPKAYEIDPRKDPFERRGSVSRSPPALSKSPMNSNPMEEDDSALITLECVRPEMPGRSVSDAKSDAITENKRQGQDQNGKMTEKINKGSTTLEDVRKERAKLEEFLFNESNKINKNAVRFILSKWMLLEGKLQEEIMGREKLKMEYQVSQKTVVGSYARAVAAAPWSGPVTSVAPATKGKKEENYEIALIKPIKEEDERNNDEIKTAVKSKLKDLRSKLKIRGMRQMRKKGIIIEVKDKEDLELIKESKLEEIGLKVEEPSKLLPAVIIYDVEKDLKVDDIKEELLNKNFENVNENCLHELKDKINFCTLL